MLQFVRCFRDIFGFHLQYVSLRQVIIHAKYWMQSTNLHSNLFRHLTSHINYPFEKVILASAVLVVFVHWCCATLSCISVSSVTCFDLVKFIISQIVYRVLTLHNLFLTKILLKLIEIASYS
jgi:hypothetical protein